MTTSTAPSPNPFNGSTKAATQPSELFKNFCRAALVQFQAAFENWQQALVMYRELGDRIEEGVTLLGLGRVYCNLGQYPKAIEFYEQAFFIVREIGDRAVEGTTLNNKFVIR